MKILNDPELVVAGISMPTTEPLPEGAETAEGIGEVEPELVRDRHADAE